MIYHALLFFHLLPLKVQTSSHHEDSSFPRVKMNFSTSLVEIPSPCTFTPESLETAMPTLPKFQEVLTDILCKTGKPVCPQAEPESEES